MTILKKLLRFVLRKKIFSEWSVEYMQYQHTKGLTPKTIDDTQRHINRLNNNIGKYSLDEITPRHIAQLVNEIVEAGTPRTAVRILQRAVDCFNLAIVYGHLKNNPAVAIKAPKVKVSRRRLSYDDFLLIRKVAKKHIPGRYMLNLALVTGQRRTDLMNMKFSDVKDDHLHITQQKTGAKIALPLNLKLDAAGLELRAVIEDCKKGLGSRKSEYMLFRRNGDQVDPSYATRVFRELRLKAGVLGDEERPAPPSLHEIRSLAERMYREQGINTQILLGHKTRAMTDKYNDDRGLDRYAIKYLVL